MSDAQCWSQLRRFRLSGGYETLQEEHKTHLLPVHTTSITKAYAYDYVRTLGDELQSDNIEVSVYPGSKQAS